MFLLPEESLGSARRTMFLIGQTVRVVGEGGRSEQLLGWARAIRRKNVVRSRSLVGGRQWQPHKKKKAQQERRGKG